MWGALVAAALAGPVEVPFSVRVFDASGTPRSGPAEVEVALYAEADGVAAAWSELWSVTLTDGFLTVVLGHRTPLPADAFASGTGWLEVRVDGERLGPRTPILPVPTARVVERLPVVVGEPYPCTEERVGRWIFDTAAGRPKVCARPGAWTRM